MKNGKYRYSTVFNVVYRLFTCRYKNVVENIMQTLQNNIECQRSMLGILSIINNQELYGNGNIKYLY